MNGLEIQALSKSFAEHVVIDDLNLTIPNGEFFVLLGPSGSGKTTLLQLITGDIKPDKGRIFLNGRDITKTVPLGRNIGTVFQNADLYPHLNVSRNITREVERWGFAVPRKELKKRVNEVAELFGLSHLLKHNILELSGGEQQRVVLARTFMWPYEAFVYDEALSSLDSKLRYQISKDILHAHRLKQRPSLYVTHNLQEAFTLGDRVTVLSQGRFQQVGTPDELLRAPANLFVAKCIETSPLNVLRGTIRYENDRYHFQTNDGTTVTLSSRWHPLLAKHTVSEFLLGIRQDAFLLPQQYTQQEVQTRTSLNVKVRDIKTVFAETFVTLQTGYDTVLEGNFTTDEEYSIYVGEKVTFILDEERIFLFDAQTECALR